MQLKIIESKKPKAKVALQGASGSGKSYTALLLAYGLCGAYEKVAVIETDYKAANHYSYFGKFNTLSINSPYTSEKFIDAIELCERSGIQVIIIDTLSAEWTGIGGMQERLKEEGVECMLWHKSLLHSIQHSNCHIIATIQATEHYSFKMVQGTKEVVKIGLQPIQKEDIHCHFHSVLSLDMQHRVKPLKDRTSFFEDNSGMVMTEQLAALYARWCGSKKNELCPKLQQRINSCKTVKELLDLMYQTDADNSAVVTAFTMRKIELDKELNENPIFSLNKTSSNGTYHHRA